MIEADAQTESDLREAVRLAMSYAANSFKAEQREELEKIPRDEFVARCHEGFDLAQKVILKNLLPLEQQLKELRAKIKTQSKGKKKKEILRDDFLQGLRQAENRIVGITYAFRRVADTIAWQILRRNKVLIRSTQTTHGDRGYLIDTNITSAVEAIARLRKPGEFYLINDLTLCLGPGAGDFLYVKADQSYSFVELKTGAENVRIFDFLDGFKDTLEQQRKRIAEGILPCSPAECQVHDFLCANSDLVTERKKRKQVERVVRQMERMHSVIEYDRTNKRKEVFYTAKGKPIERNRTAIVMKTQDEHAFAEIDKVLTNVSQEAPYFGFLSYGSFLSFLVADNGKAGPFSTKLSPFVRVMNARHMIYHHIHDNMADCAFGRGPQHLAKEIGGYSQLFVFNWVIQAIGDGSLMPPFLMSIKMDLLFDVLFGRKSIFIYFDHVRFAEFVNDAAAGKFVLKADLKPDREWSGLQILVPNRKARQGVSKIGWGILLRMLVEFQDPETVRQQMLEMMEAPDGFPAEDAEAVGRPVRVRRTSQTRPALGRSR